jgi:hypothetical protein
MADIEAAAHRHVQRQAARRAEQAAVEAKEKMIREAVERERQQRAETHRLRALEPLADKLAGVVFDHVEASAGRVLVRAQLASALHAALLRSGLAQDPPFQQPRPD